MENSNKQTAVEWLVEQMIYQMDIRIENTTIGCELFEQAKEMEKQQRKIEFPSDKEIKEYTNSIRYYGHCTYEYREGIEDGVKWVRDKIIGGNK